MRGDRLITRDGTELELEDRELEETAIPGRLREILEEFADAQGLSRRRREWLDDGFIPHAPPKGLTHGHLPRLRTPGGPMRFSPEWWKQRHARLKADPVRYAKDHAQKLAWQRKKYREDEAYRKRRIEEAKRRMRAWYAKVKADPVRRKRLMEDVRRRANARYQRLKTDPGERQRYEDLLRKANARARASYQRRKERS
jgi:hypothetical protein